MGVTETVEGKEASEGSHQTPFQHFQPWVKAWSWSQEWSTRWQGCDHRVSRKLRGWGLELGRVDTWSEAHLCLLKRTGPERKVQSLSSINTPSVLTMSRITKSLNGIMALQCNDQPCASRLQNIIKIGKFLPGLGLGRYCSI